MPKPRWIRRWLSALLALVVSLSAAQAVAQSATEPQTPQADRHLSGTAGSYDVAPVRILGIPALVVASPQVHQSGAVVEAQRRAAVIEGNLRLLYAPQALCTDSELLSEELLEGVVLGGPKQQRLCSGDPWAVQGDADQLLVEAQPGPAGSVVLQARLPDRPVPLPLLTVTAADGALYGLQPAQLAEQWREVLQRRLRHARRTMQPDQLNLRWKAALVVELLLLATSVACFKLWTLLRHRLRDVQQNGGDSTAHGGGRRFRMLWMSRIALVLVLLQGVAMVAIAVAVIPGQVPLALELILQPLEVLSKTAAVAAGVVALRWLYRLLLRQWRSNPNVPAEQLARRQQRYDNLLQAGQRLLNLGGLIVLLILVISGLPGIGAMSLSTWLAGGALLGALAFVFQGLLRDFVAGLVILLEDHYAVGDWVDVDGLGGTVEDVGVLATSLRCLDQRVVVIPNSRCDRLVNHTRIRSGVELVIPLPPSNPQLEKALALVAEEVKTFSTDDQWQGVLLEQPNVRGVKRVTPVAVELSVLLTTHAGDQWAAERALLRRIVARLEQEGIAMAQVQAMPVL